MTDRTSMPTLQEQIEIFEKQLFAMLPPDMLTTWQNEIKKIVQSGVAAQGLGVGEVAPDFTLPDTAGQAVTLSNLLAQGPVVLLFYRGDWCSYCDLALRAYQAILPEITALGATMVAVSPQRVKHSQATAEKRDLTFPLLSDQGNEVAHRYRLVFTMPDVLRSMSLAAGVDLAEFNGDPSWGLPVPGTYVIGMDGVVQLAFVEANYTRRLEPAQILAALRPQ